MLNGSFTDEWVSYFVQYSYTLHHYYDHGYNTRFSDSESTALKKLETYHNAVSKLLLRLFGVATYADYELIESCVDSCQEMLFGEENCYNDIEKVQQQINCNHGTNGGNIHMRLEALRKETLWTNTLMPVVWTGYVFLDDAPACWFGKSIVISSYNTTKYNDDTMKFENIGKDVDKMSKYALFHEVCHSLGAKDHYCYSSNDRPCSNDYCDKCVFDMRSPRLCAMTSMPFVGIEKAPIDYLLCEDCIQFIRNHLVDHH